MKDNTKTSLALAIGTTFVSGMSATVAIADTNKNADPFAMTELSDGYMNMAEAGTDAGAKMKMKDAACGEGKCGGKMKAAGKAMEGKCAGNKPGAAAKDKAMEGKCGDKMKAAGKAMEGKCGDKMKKAGKAMEGKCGDKMKKAGKAMEGKCGDKMKSK